MCHVPDESKNIHGCKNWIKIEREREGFKFKRIINWNLDRRMRVIGQFYFRGSKFYMENGKL